MTRRAQPSMRSNSSTVRRAGRAGGETASIEPFDDVSEAGAPEHAAHAEHAHGINGINGAGIAYAAHKANGDSLGQGQGQGQDHATDTQHEPLSPDDPLAPLPFNPYKGNRGLTRAWHAMKNSLAGFQVAIREESAFRQELTLAAILIPCGVLVPVEPVSRVLLLGSVLLVLIVELLNSSVEAAIDRISLERHELSRRAKDLGSAAVMVALGMCLMTWGLIVGPLVVRWVGAWF
ncbi:diacylglycerol kinase (ATP) [Paraburkholderia fungorum]|uniref:Diacylglycerol kinase n=1 Tax=Paraburkholderia fungorum TaxID=134537 RepID=A0A1H1AMK4_9BURK|nr:diacylglycerol kinase (ATP) [Paraburkholderia fungorum]